MTSCNGGAERVTVSFGQELGAACLEILVFLVVHVHNYWQDRNVVYSKGGFDSCQGPKTSDWQAYYD